MRHSLFATVVIGLIVAGCAKENATDLTNTNTFIRYYNGGLDDEAIAVKEVNDGFIILSNTFVEPNDAAPYWKIKLTKTDLFGNVQWKKLYPEFAGEIVNTSGLSYKGYDLLVKEDANLNVTGYVVVGEDINTTGISNPLIMQIDNLGENFNKVTLTAPGVSARAISKNPKNENYLILAQSGSNMFLAEFRANPFSDTPSPVIWQKEYVAGTINNLVNKLFTNSAGNVYWGGTVTKNASTSKVRFIKTTQNSDLVESDPVIGNPLFNETAKDITRYGFGFATIGTTNGKPGNTTGDTDILFRRLTEDGAEIPGQVKSYQLGGKEENGDQVEDLKGNEEGNSIYATQDGGLILLGTVDSKVGTGSAEDTSGSTGRGEKDLYLIKINPFGDVAWTKILGSKFNDLGVSVIQTKDGGILVLGTSDISGTLKTVTLIKTDKNGNIE